MNGYTEEWFDDRSMTWWYLRKIIADDIRRWGWRTAFYNLGFSILVDLRLKQV